MAGLWHGIFCSLSKMMPSKIHMIGLVVHIQVLFMLVMSRPICSFCKPAWRLDSSANAPGMIFKQFPCCNLAASCRLQTLQHLLRWENLDLTKEYKRVKSTWTNEGISNYWEFAWICRICSKQAVLHPDDPDQRRWNKRWAPAKEYEQTPNSSYSCGWKLVTV